MVGAGHHHDLVGLAQAHNPNAAAVPALNGDVRRVHPDDDAFLAAQQHVVGLVHNLDAGHLVLGRVVVADALAAPGGDAVALDLGTAALALLGDGEDGAAGTADADAHNFIPLGQADGTDAVAAAAHGPGVALGEPDGLAVPGGHDQHIAAGGQAGPGQGIALVQGNADQAVFADVGVLGQGSPLDQALFGHHGDKAALARLFGVLAEHIGDLFALGQGQQVDDVGALAGAAALGDGVALQPEDTAPVGDKEDVVMGGAHEQLLDNVLFLPGHAGNAPAAPVLGLVGGLGLALDIARLGEGVDALFLGDQVLDVHLTGDRLDLGAAVVGKAALDVQKLVLNDGQNPAVVGQNVLPVLDLGPQGGQLLLDLEDFQTSQTAQLQLHDGIGLGIVETELFHNSRLGLGHAALAGADGGDQLIHDIGGFLEALQNMGPLLGLSQVVLGAAADDLVLELHILLDHLLEGQHPGDFMVNGDHDDAHGVLKLGVLIQLVQHHLGVGLFADVNDDPHPLAVGLVVQVGDALDPLVLDQLGDALNQPGLVDHIGDLGNHDLVPAVLLFLDGGPAPEGNLAPAGGIGGPDAAAAHDDAGGGEVGALDILHQAGQVDVGVVDVCDAPVDHFAQVVGRDVGGHAHRDALAAVDQQVGEAAGQHLGLLFGVVVVGVPVDGVLVDVGEHLHGHPAHAGLGVTVGGRGVAVHRAEVALAVHQGIAHGKILGQADHGVVDRRVAVGVVRAQHRADGIGRLAVGVGGVVAALVHGEQDAPVDRLQAVPDVGQGPGDDDRHGVIQKGGLDLFFDVPDDLFGPGAGYHDVIFFHSSSRVCESPFSALKRRAKGRAALLTRPVWRTARCSR